MYRIRTYKSDGTLGDFWGETGTVSDPSLAKTYSSTHEALEDLDQAHKNSGSELFPKLNYGISTQSLADQEKLYEDRYSDSVSPKNINQFSIAKQPLPPFEDKPSRNIDSSTAPRAVDIDGGLAISSQELDVDGGGA